MKLQIRNGDFTFISKLRYFGSQIHGTDGFCRSKTEELETWIDYNFTQGHGPPTHFIKLTCAENWWADLKRILSNNVESIKYKSHHDHFNEFWKHCKNVKQKTLYVNQFFMNRAKIFMDSFARTSSGIEHYWGRVEFSGGRGQIHIHLFGIAKHKGYLPAFLLQKLKRNSRSI